MSEPLKSDRTAPLSGTDVCAASDVVDGKAKVVAVSRGGPAIELIVVREGATVCAYINECAHNSVPLNLLDDYGVESRAYQMHCDHHYAAFRFSDGYCTVGPCEGESLTRVPVRVQAGRVVVARPEPQA
jgi:nitrite reductase/ring-hydroxylating ferredoxin subunit